MLWIENTLISEDILEEHFVCDLQQCKGACCVEGDAGAPIEAEEVHLLEKEAKNIAPFLREEGRQAIAEQGSSVIDSLDGEPVTPLVAGAECAYAVFDATGKAACGIEKAWQAGATTFRKPISCHLYPVRLGKAVDMVTLNYHRWEICSPACSLGQELKVPVFRFTKDALLRKFGAAWYQQLELAAQKNENENADAP